MCGPRWNRVAATMVSSNARASRNAGLSAPPAPQECASPRPAATRAGSLRRWTYDQGDPFSGRAKLTQDIPFSGGMTVTSPNRCASTMWSTTTSRNTARTSSPRAIAVPAMVHRWVRWPAAPTSRCRSTWKIGCSPRSVPRCRAAATAICRTTCCPGRKRSVPRGSMASSADSTVWVCRLACPISPPTPTVWAPASASATPRTAA